MRLPLHAILLSAACAVLPTVSVAAGPAAISPAKQSSTHKIASADSLLDLNTATPAQLKALPGMGDAYVKRIVDGRPYTAKNQLVRRGILPADAYEAIKDQVVAHRPKR